MKYALHCIYIVLYNLNIINSFLCFTISIHIQIEMTFREIKLTIMYLWPPPLDPGGGEGWGRGGVDLVVLRLSISKLETDSNTIKIRHISLPSFRPWRVGLKTNNFYSIEKKLNLLA